MFINRGKELAFLEQKWLEDRAQMIVIWGKRRVGKTELIKQFISNKPHLYFLAEATEEKDQLKRFSSEIGKHFRESLLLTRGFSTWEESFTYLTEKGQRIILVMDEFGYLIQSNKGIPTVFQRLWDDLLSRSRIFLVLMGSSVGLMETEVLGYRAPLYGRRTGQWKVQPLPFSEARKFRPGRSFEDQICHFAVAGGIPAYWQWLSARDSFSENLKKRILARGQPFYDEVEFILREELREPRFYFSLLKALALGKRRLSEMVNATGLPQPTANKYLSVLIDLDLIEREIPVTEEKPYKSKKGLYRIKDEFINFWFRYVFPRRSLLEMDEIELAARAIMDDLPAYLSFVYEKVAMEILKLNSGDFFEFNRLGRWWDRNEEIDIVGLNRERNRSLFGEVKWSKNLVGVDVLKSLQEKAKKVTWGNDKTIKLLVLFSRAGFTPELIKIAAKERIALFKGEKRIV